MCDTIMFIVVGYCGKIDEAYDKHNRTDIYISPNSLSTQKEQFHKIR